MATNVFNTNTHTHTHTHSLLSMECDSENRGTCTVRGKWVSSRTTRPFGTGLLRRFLLPGSESGWGRLTATSDGGTESVLNLGLAQDLLEDAHDVEIVFGRGLHVTVAPLHADDGLGRHAT